MAQGVRVVFASETVQPDSPAPSPDGTESESAGRFLIEVGLVDASMLDRLPEEPRERSQILLQPPEG